MTPATRDPDHGWPDYQGPDESSRFLAFAHAGSNVFLTGAAGTGKTYTLRQFIEEARRKNRPLAVTASTGIAALNLGGITTHRWAGIQLGAKGRETNEDAAYRLESKPMGLAKARQRILQTRTLIIDEVSMFPGRQLDFLDFWLRRVREDERPFGGIQVILCGDFCQLPPVRKDESRDYDWAFTSEVWQAGFLRKSICLEKVRRQDEAVFTDVLQRVRVGRLKGYAKDILTTRVLDHPPNNRPRIVTHNSAVDRWCDFQLSKLHGEPTVFEGVAKGTEDQVASLTKHILAPARLELKVGARVMNLVNRDLETHRGLPVFIANGQLGTVTEFTDASVLVKFDNSGSEPLEVPKFTWRWSEYREPSFTQIPLRLAYAMTVHKCQGLTLDEAHLDIRAAREPGQAYVAVSRVRTLAGLTLKEMPSGIFVSDAAIEFYRELTRPPADPRDPPGEPGSGPRIAGRRVAEAKPPPPPAEDEGDQIPFEFSKPETIAGLTPASPSKLPIWQRGGPDNFTGD